MRSKFLEFRYCEGGWKVHLFATVHYPDYIAKKSGNVFYTTFHHLHCSRYLTSSDQKCKAKSDADPGNSQKQKKTKKRHSNDAPPLDANVIDIATDEPSAAHVDSTPSSASPPAAGLGSLMTPPILPQRRRLLHARDHVLDRWLKLSQHLPPQLSR